MYWGIHIEGGPQRVNHAAVAVESNIYSFGGFCRSKADTLEDIDVTVLDTETLRWSVLEYGAETPEAVPFNRYGHTVVLYDDKVYLWGGRSDISSSDILHCFDIEKHEWSLPKVYGAIPNAADGHSACVINHHMYIFGGFEDQTEQLNDRLYRINLQTFMWQVVYTNGDMLQSRDFHTASVINTRMYIFGGRGEPARDLHGREVPHFNDIVYLDTSTMTWVYPVTTGKSPDGRRSHSAVVYKNKIYILYGYSSLKRRHFNDIHCFNPETNHWTKLQPKGHAPVRRRRQCCCMVGDLLYLFGGTSPLRSAYPEYSTNQQQLENYPMSSSELIDQSDLHVLDFCPTLRRLCFYEIIMQNLIYECLPTNLKKEIYFLTTNNNMNQPAESSGR